jgi:hypothetical protein
MTLALVGPTTWVVGAVAVFVVVGLVGTLARGDVYDEIGTGGFSTGDGGAAASPPGPAAGSAAERAEQEAEIRQMLQARNERLKRKGEPPVDIDAELARLLGPAAGVPGKGNRDPMLVDEVRQLVVARNERRARRGEPPLDVEREIERTLAELDPDG